MAGLPFSRVVELLQGHLCQFWAHQGDGHLVIGSQAMRAHMSPAVRAALCSGVVDVDLVVHVAPARGDALVAFEELARQSLLVLQAFVMRNGLSWLSLDCRVQWINEIVVCKYFWNSFRFADVQFAADARET